MTAQPEPPALALSIASASLPGSPSRSAVWKLGSRGFPIREDELMPILAQALADQEPEVRRAAVAVGMRADCPVQRVLA